MARTSAQTQTARNKHVLTIPLAVVMALLLAAAVPAQASTAHSRGPQGLPGPPQSSPPPAAQLPQLRGPQGLPGPPQSSPPAAQSPDAARASSDGGHSAAIIVLLCLAGTSTLVGVACAATRAGHRHRAVT